MIRASSRWVHQDRTRKIGLSLSGLLQHSRDGDMVQRPHPRVWIAANVDGMVRRIARNGET